MEPNCPKLTRSNTVLSLLYRLWGRVATVKILQYWAAKFPFQVIGFLPGRSLANSMLSFQWKSVHGRSHLDLTPRLSI